MPCDDVSEFVEVELDDRECLVAYRIAKLSCGKSVGAQSLLLARFAGQTVSDLLRIDPATFLPEAPVRNSVEEFLTLKHLFALQAALGAYVGDDAAGASAPFAVASVAFSELGTVIHGQLSIDMVTDKIRACGACGC